MEVYIRFLTFSAKTPKGYCAFTLPDGATSEDLIQAVDAAGQTGTFSAPADWPGMPEHVLLAAEGHMLRPEEQLQEGQQISIIGQMIGG